MASLATRPALTVRRLGDFARGVVLPTEVFELLRYSPGTPQVRGDPCCSSPRRSTAGTQTTLGVPVDRSCVTVAGIDVVAGIADYITPWQSWTETGEVFEVHALLDEYSRWTLVQYEGHRPQELPPRSTTTGSDVQVPAGSERGRTSVCPSV